MSTPRPSLAAQRKRCREALPQIVWAAESWAALGWLGARRMERALRRELPAGHALSGRAPRALAHDCNHDDVLFALSDGEVVSVHLGFGPRSSDPHWPATSFYDSLEEFLGGLAAEFTADLAVQRSFELGAETGPVPCPDCGLDWSGGLAKEGCTTCDGWPLARPCPICAGACGAIWTRAGQDSMEMRQAHWVGSCKLTGP